MRGVLAAVGTENFLDIFFSLLNDFAQRTVVLRQKPFGFGGRTIHCGHDTGGFYVFVRGKKTFFGDTAVYAGNPLNHIQGPSIKLFVADIDINHQVFVGFAEPNHGSGGYHVENHFLSGTRFHSRGAVNGLRTDERIDKDVGIGFEFCLRIGGDGNGFGAAAPGFCKHGHDIGGIAAGRNADNNVAGAGIESFKVFDGQFGIVFRAVDRSADTFVAAGDETLNQVSSMPKVCGQSVASSMAILPLVPAPK